MHQREHDLLWLTLLSLSVAQLVLDGGTSCLSSCQDRFLVSRAQDGIWNHQMGLR